MQEQHISPIICTTHPDMTYEVTPIYLRKFLCLECLYLLSFSDTALDNQRKIVMDNQA